MSESQNPESQSVPYQSTNDAQPVISNHAIELLRQTSLWVRIMSILLFIGAALMFLAGLFMMGAAMLGGASSRNGPPAFIGCIYIPLSLLYIAPAIFLSRYATKAKAFAKFRYENILTEAIQAQKSFWKFCAITALVIIGLYLLLIPTLIIIAILSR